ncbi:MAG TPA: glycosyltransferase family 39 protein [Candidatus Binatia bacterium]|nr:glycosyltransferase family 39 protein [Candidatus Binatia bacterium]
MRPRSGLTLHLIFLVALCGAIYFPYLGNTPFFDKGEPREALAVQDIVQRGEWLFPLKRATAIPSKPPLFHWSAALVSELTGALNETTIRFPSALYATLGVLLIYVLGRALYGAAVALLAGAILATTMAYSDQALSARVDMTLCFFLTLSLVLFYSLYRGFLAHRLWYFAFYFIVGIGTLAKGPLGILLPGLVIAGFLTIKRRWDLIMKFAFHPGVVLTLLLAGGWYGLAVTRGGEGFVDRQLLQENLKRFFGGSGHSHPIHYYLPYLFSLGLPWSFFFPFLLWDLLRKSRTGSDDHLFLESWFVIMFVFFSLSAGKRPVYLLPIYPPLSLLLADWIYQQNRSIGWRLLLYRTVALIAAATALILLIISFGALWNHEAGWFFAPIASLLKPKDRANLLVVQNALDNFGAVFTVIVLVMALLWLALSRAFWFGQIRPAALFVLGIAIVFGVVSRAMVIPVIAADKSYREFVVALDREIGPKVQIYLFGEFNSDPVVFYHQKPMDVLEQPLAEMAKKVGAGTDYVIMPRETWEEIEKIRPGLAPPILSSTGKGAEGDAPLVLVRAQIT